MNTTILGLGPVVAGVNDISGQEKLKSLIVSTLLSRTGVEGSYAIRAKAEEVGVQLFPISKNIVDDTDVNIEYVHRVFGRLIKLTLAANDPNSSNKARVLAREFVELNKRIDGLALELDTTAIGAFVDGAVKTFDFIIK